MTSMRTGEDRHLAVGFDFGTTNSSVAIVEGDARVQLASFPSAGAETQSFPAVLYFEQYKKQRRGEANAFANRPRRDRTLFADSR